MSVESINEDIMSAVRVVQPLVDAEFAKCGGAPPKGSGLDQCGLHDGIDIVLEYVLCGEPGAALEHVVYMIEAAEIDVGPAILERVRRAATAMGMKVRI